jgi:hydroxyacyl-ACP dehydratase HTD2-like protein with hotdog domain
MLMPDSRAVKVGDALPERCYTPTNVSLFLYNAAIWNAHRIHYDERYTTGVEKHAGIVIDGPLQGDWLTQTVLEWLGQDGVMVTFQYSNRRASYLGETLTSGGTVTAVDPVSGEVKLDLFIKNAAGDITTPGSATVHLHQK